MSDLVEKYFMDAWRPLSKVYAHPPVLNSQADALAWIADQHSYMQNQYRLTDPANDKTPPPKLTLDLGEFEKAITVSQFPWTAVKMRRRPIIANGVPQPHYNYSYDMWEWNVYKMKWVRLSNTACGFGEQSDADRCAKERSDEIQDMLDSNKNHPPVIK